MTSRVRVSAVLTGMVGLVMALAWSWAPYFWRDERATLRDARLPWAKLWPFLRHRDLVHGAYYALLHPWLAGFGISHFAARFPSAVAIAFAVGGVTTIGYRLAGLRAGISAGLVLALLPVTSHYGMEARSYATACALVTWAGYFLLRATEPGASSRWWVGYAVLLLAAGVVFIYALLVGLSHTIGLAVGRRSVRRQFLVLVVVGIVISPLIFLASRQSNQVSWISRVIVGNVIDAPLSWVVSVPQPHSGFGARGTPLLHGAAVLIAVLLWGLVGRAVVVIGLRRQRERPGMDVLAFAAPWLVLPATVLIVASLIQPMFVERYVFFSAPAFALLIGYTLARLRLGTLIVCVTVLALLAAPLWLADREPEAKTTTRSSSGGSVA